MRRRLGICALALVALAPSGASGQVNTEKMRSWESPGLGGSVDFSLTHRSGNVSLLQVGTAVRVQWASLRPKTSSTAPDRLQDLVYVVGNLDLGIRSDERFKNAGFGHLRWTHMWLPAFGSEVFAQIQYNEFIRLQERYLGGIGGRLVPVTGDNGEIVVGSGYMLELEINDVPEDGPDARRVLAHRWTSYVSIKGYLQDPNVSVVETVYLQPRLTDFSDYRLLSEAELSVEVAPEVLSLVAGVYLRYDSDPVQDIEPLDVTFLNKLRLAF